MNIQPSRLLAQASVVLSCTVFLAACSQPQTPATGSNTQAQVSQQSSQASQQTTVAEMDSKDVINLMIDLEDNFGLKDVIANQAEASFMVRMQAPTITGVELDNGLAQVFGYLNEKLPQQIQTINLIFDINHVDSALIAMDRKDIQDWKDKKITNADFIKKIKKTSLL